MSAGSLRSTGHLEDWPPLTDDQIRKLGYEPTPEGWRPLRNVAGGGEPPEAEGSEPEVIPSGRDPLPATQAPAAQKKQRKPVRPKRQARQIRSD